MCIGTRCQHHIDPAVLHLEMDYEHMGVGHGGEVDGLVHTHLIDNRTGHHWYQGPNGVGHAQPMLKMKQDIGWAEQAHWDGFEGPGLHNEEDMSIGHADRIRSDLYTEWLYQYLFEHELPITDDLLIAHAAHVEENRRAQERADREFQVRQEAARREAARARAERQRRGEPAIQGARADYVIRDEVAMLSPEALAQTHAYMYALQNQLQETSMAVSFFVNSTNNAEGSGT